VHDAGNDLPGSLAANRDDLFRNHFYIRSSKPAACKKELI
jgi:hypothetical protein